MVIFDETIGSIQVDYRDYFVDDYNSVEDLIKDIEQNSRLSAKDKEKIVKCFSKKEEV